MKDKNPITDQEALDFHEACPRGKLSIVPSKPLDGERDLSLAYSPGVAVPCREIHKDPDLAYKYTSKANLVGVITNGTAVLGLGNLGALASKPVMEGKAALFKRFADIDSMDIEVDSEEIESFVRCVRMIGNTFGGVNLEDIRAPDCFAIEQRLRESLDIPVFHDDQHGTAIVVAAGLLNAFELTGRDIQQAKVVINGAGSAGIACADLINHLGVAKENIILCDRRGVIYTGRKDGMNHWKEIHAVDTDARTLEDALKGADVFLGVSVKGAVTQAMVKTMAEKPIIFAMANPDPEILPEEVKVVSPDAIMATGRSDYPNQVNNLLGFPYIFRGALDVHAREINNEMMVMAVHALANLAKQPVDPVVKEAYPGRTFEFGPDYIIPTTFDPRLMAHVASAVAEGAIKSGVARRPFESLDLYRETLWERFRRNIQG